MKALASISYRPKCPNYSRSGPFLLDISFSIRTETANSDKKENPSGEGTPGKSVINTRRISRRVPGRVT